jgi:hypothetical protein
MDALPIVIGRIVFCAGGGAKSLAVDTMGADAPGPVGGWLAIALVLLLILILILAAVAMSQPPTARSPPVVGGGTLGQSGLSSKMLAANTRSFLDAAREGSHHPTDAIALSATGGAAHTPTKKKPKAMQPWRSYATWNELMKDKGALDVYWEERSEILNSLPDDWAKVRKQAAPLIADPFEWAGHIDIVKGQLQIVSKYPSKAKEKQPEWSAVRASVSPEVAQKVWSKPALFVFHTHPEEKNQLDAAHPPSPPDLSSAIFSSFKGHYAAELVLSRTAIYMYGLRAARRTALWNMPHPSLEVTRVAFDAFCAFSSMRSYAEFYSLAELEALTGKFGMFYVTYPGDGYAQSRFNHLIQLASHVDVSELRQRAEELDEAQKEVYDSTKKRGRK